MFMPIIPGMDRKRFFWSALTVGMLTACSAANPVVPTAEANAYTPPPAPPTEVIPFVSDASIGTESLAPIPPESNNPESFRMNMRACLETQTPNRSCDDATDLPIKGAELGIVYQKNGLRQVLTSGENGSDQETAVFNDVADRANINGVETTVAGVRIQIPHLKLNVQMPDGTVVEACILGLTGQANDYDYNFDIGFSPEACDPIPAPFEESAMSGQIIN
jgi:hypothetical protein